VDEEEDVAAYEGKEGLMSAPFHPEGLSHILAASLKSEL